MRWIERHQHRSNLTGAPGGARPPPRRAYKWLYRSPIQWMRPLLAYELRNDW